MNTRKLVRHSNEGLKGTLLSTAWEATSGLKSIPDAIPTISKLLMMHQRWNAHMCDFGRTCARARAAPKRTVTVVSEKTFENSMLANEFGWEGCRMKLQGVLELMC